MAMSKTQTLLEIGKALIAETNLEKLLPLAIDKVIAETQAERGMIIIYNEEEEMIFEAARHLSRKDIDKPEFEISKTIIASVRADGKPVVVKNALADPRLDASTSIPRLRLLSVACAPLRAEGKFFGVIYIDNRNLAAAFEESTGELLAEFAELISAAAHNALERHRLLARQRELQNELAAQQGYGALLGRSAAMKEIFKLIEKVAPTETTVLITGETGCGKELVARELHRKSARADREFVALNCAALPETLLESELFGHEKGAFTGADRKRRGQVEVAEGGTLLLDEIGEMSAALQAKLLRLLQSGEYKPLGSETVRQANARVLAATHRDLRSRIAEGLFREDLFYRLNVIEIKLPPLREREDDILLMAEYFLARWARQANAPAKRLSEEARALLLQHAFPGNVRELENLVQRAAILSEGEEIQADDLPLAFTAVASGSAEKPPSNFMLAKQSVIEKFEREFLATSLQETRGNISEAARRAGMYKKNFIEKMKQYEIKREEFI
jgi:transcriptional regulator with GAF, ATPase, and Fis domain